MATLRNCTLINSTYKQFLLLMMAIEGGTFNASMWLSLGFTYVSMLSYRAYRLSGRTTCFGNGSGQLYATPEDDNIPWSRIIVSTINYGRYVRGDVSGAYAWVGQNNNTVIYTPTESPTSGSNAYSDTACTVVFG